MNPICVGEAVFAKIDLVFQNRFETSGLRDDLSWCSSALNLPLRFDFKINM